ncbi:P-loop containing nucleoside triphosphate hydrolase protein, partial [Serendipita vermifera]
VLGNTGCGKSSFINAASGSEQMPVSVKLRSNATEVAATKPFKVDGRSVVLLDTPGFDNTQGAKFNDIIEDVKNYLNREFEQETLKGIIFLHALNETKALNSTMKNIKRFRQICGNDIRYALIVVTTMWDIIPREDALRRETELKADPSFLKIFTDEMVAFKRHPNTIESGGESAQDIIRSLLDPRNKPRRRDWWKAIFTFFF